MKGDILDFLKKFIILVFMGTLFVIVLSLFMVGMGNQKYDNLPQFLIKSKNIILKKQDTKSEKIKVYITKENTVKEMDLEQYVTGVVAAEMPAEFSEEALKAQAVASRTFAVAHMEVYGGKKYKSNTGADVCDTVKCQVFVNKEDRMKNWPKSEGDKYWSKIVDAVQATSGQVLTYKNKLVMEPYYFAVSAGKTENSEDVFGEAEGYLKSVESPGEESARKYKTSVKMSYVDFINKVNSNYANSGLSSENLPNQIGIKSKNESGSVKEIKLGDVTISGTKFRTIMGLNSANFSIDFKDGVYIQCIGYGHGVGMSQWGANYMGKNGQNYKNILSHYYEGTSLENVNLFKK
ncbi:MULTISPECIES: stage II sporulation protein D [Clostridium]|uniref:Amidase enhancer n=1 Tax=Clostridium ragsdalei P11 TaxID=1353534 RepID=A0A1A6AP30_9CLOT|nr:MULTISPECIES: stage II sporulation protein D [Clostridium]OBR91829.1 amidase enhancer precursor [Clostridium ragsdalei P11]QXE19487.1 stage II sporulation protein D [Clostridium sp. 001]